MIALVVSARSINSRIETSGSGSTIGGGAGYVSWPSAVDTGAIHANTDRVSNTAPNWCEILEKILGARLF